MSLRREVSYPTSLHPMHGRLGSVQAARRGVNTDASTGIKRRGQRGVNAAALIEAHRELLTSLTPEQHDKLKVAYRKYCTRVLTCPLRFYDMQGAFLAHGLTSPGFITAKELGPVRNYTGAPSPRRSIIQVAIPHICSC
jgi:hypothetical protein